MAIVLCQLPVLIQIVGLALTGLWISRQWQRLSLGTVLYHDGGPDDTINCWGLEYERSGTVDGKLVHRGYRSASLLVLAVQSNDSRKIHRIPVWRDSVSARDYSYLNLQLMLNTHQPDDHGKGCG
ncbi:MAG: hypothetical protein AB8B64_17530 [Granulosicoccus sp.]